MSESKLINITIRPVAESEIEDIADLARIVWLEAYSDIITKEQIDYMLEDRYNADRMRSEMISGKVWWDVACAQINNQEMHLGFASTQFTEEPGTMKVDKLYIHPHYHRQGIGRHFIDHVAQRALDLSCHRLVLAVNKNNVRAIAAYKNYGFKMIASVVKDIGHGFSMDDYIFEKTL